MGRERGRHHQTNIPNPNNHSLLHHLNRGISDIQSFSVPESGVVAGVLAYEPAADTLLLKRTFRVN